MELEIAKKIIEARKRSGMSQDKLAALIGFKNHANISLMEKGVRRIEIGTLKKVADALEVPLESLLPNEWLSQEKAHGMQMNEYQALAARTINKKLEPVQVAFHALHGMVGEIGEIHSLYQKTYQGHELLPGHMKKELGDLLWFIAEYCTAFGWSLEDIAQMNIDKLKARYPEGFSEDKSLHRKEGDI